jgi:hypothetical protein
LNSDPPKDANELAHNPRLGAFLKEQMDRLGIECIFRTPKDYPGQRNRPFTTEMVDFFQHHCAK